MALTRKVNGKRVAMKKADEAAILAEWQAKPPRPRAEIRVERAATKAKARALVERVLPKGVTVEEFLDALDTLRL